MFCNKCGAENPIDASFCKHCGAQMGAAYNQGYYGAPYQPPQPLPSNTGQLVWAIINILLFLPLGIPALIFAIQAGSAATVQIAEKNLKTAQTLNIIATIAAVVTVVLSFLFAFTLLAALFNGLGYSEFYGSDYFGF